LSDYKDVYFNDTVFMARAKEYADTAFEFAGKQAGMITDELRATVHTAIDNQWTEKQFSDAMKSFQLRYTGDVADEAKQLNSRFRTGMNKALNEARMDIYQDEVACVALQYSSVLDEMTTQICIELDGTVWLKKNHEWEFYLPPNHFGCRSTIVPIFNDDDFKLTSADRKFPKPAEGFGGPAGAVVKPAGKPVPHPGYKTATPIPTPQFKKLDVTYDNMVKWAEDQGVNEWIAELSVSERSALFAYRKSSNVNKFLRDPSSSYKNKVALNKQISNMDSALSKSILKENTVFYRGINGGVNFNDIVIDGIINDAAFVSTSFYKEVANAFSGFGTDPLSMITTEIRVAAGKSFAFLEPLVETGANWRTAEVLLSKGGRYKIIEKIAGIRNLTPTLGEFGWKKYWKKLPKLILEAI